MSFLHPNRPEPAMPMMESLTPRAAIPGGTFEVRGTNLLVETAEGPQMPVAHFGGTAAEVLMVRAGRARVRVPEGAIASELTLRAAGEALHATGIYANIGVPMADNLHMVANPCVDRGGNLYAMVSGSRGQRVPVSIYRIQRDLQIRPFVRDLMNISALAMGPDDCLYASSRSEGLVYRISPSGSIATFAEGMGVATGIAFDREGNLFVGDRSGTIFKISPSQEIFVFATLEPSVAAYHLCFHPDGRLLVAAPNTGSYQDLMAIDRDGNASVYFRGLGRPQGMAFDEAGTLYIAASLGGQRGIIRIEERGAAEVFVSGNDLVGLCFLEDGCVALAAAQTVYHLDVGVNGLALLRG